MKINETFFSKPVDTPRSAWYVLTMNKGNLTKENKMSAYDLDCYMAELRLPLEIRKEVYEKLKNGSTVASARTWLDSCLHDYRSDA